MKFKLLPNTPIIISGLLITLIIIGSLTNSKQQNEEELIVPEVIGLHLSDAKEKLLNTSFNFKLVYEESPQPAGMILRQIPQKGSYSQEGTLVTLFVAKPERWKPNSKQRTDPNQPSSPDIKTNSISPNSQTNQKNTQKSKAELDAERKAIADRLRAEAEAEAKLAQQKIAEEQARLSLEQAQKDALYNAMIAASNEVISAREALRQAVASVNDFAARGMLQSGAGMQASATRDAAQQRYDSALIAEQAAIAAWNSR